MPVTVTFGRAALGAPAARIAATADFIIGAVIMRVHVIVAKQGRIKQQGIALARRYWVGCDHVLRFVARKKFVKKTCHRYAASCSSGWL